MTEPTRSLSLSGKDGKLRSITAIPHVSEFTISSCSEGRTRDVHSSSLLIDVYALFSDVSLRQLELQ